MRWWSPLTRLYRTNPPDSPSVTSFSDCIFSDSQHRDQRASCSDAKCCPCSYSDDERYNWWLTGRLKDSLDRCQIYGINAHRAVILQRALFGFLQRCFFCLNLVFLRTAQVFRSSRLSDAMDGRLAFFLLLCVAAGAAFSIPDKKSATYASRQLLSKHRLRCAR